MISDLLRRAWRRLPLSIQRKQRLQRRLFASVPWAFSHTTAYKAWQDLHYDPDESRTAAPANLDDGPVPLLDASPAPAPRVRLIAFYLPQFHPIPENDAWWGRGFTEWTNVVRGKPQFVGHYQPHLPGELGFYDLRLVEVQERQIELAKLYGIGGFAFYFYWFGGKRLLERPVRQFLENKQLDLPFCLCWANENWSRRWDGRDEALLITQHHSPADDQAFIAHVAEYLRDPRYIRINGRPLLIVYRPDLLPNARATVLRWRGWCRDNGIGELYLAYTQSFEATDPAGYGFDAAIEFPPNNTSAPIITGQVELLNPEFSGVVYDWRAFPAHSRRYRTPAYPLFRGVNPSWDNEARRSGGGGIYFGSSPSGYREWLSNAIGDTIGRFENEDERLVFVNAWNEWAEGAHLEPDQRHGYAYLQATREALTSTGAGVRRILVVTHDAQTHGAQMLALNLVRELAAAGYEVHTAVLGPGPLVDDYRRHSRVHLLMASEQDGDRAHRLATSLREQGVTDALVNSTASGRFVTALGAAGIRVLSLIHELPQVIRSHGLIRHTAAIAAGAATVVFPAQPVAEGFVSFSPVAPEHLLIRPQGLYKRNRLRHAKGRREARRDLRRQLGLEQDCELVLCVGYGDRRKGLDLFVEAGLRLLERRHNLAFVWVGTLDASIEPTIRARLARSDQVDRFLFVGQQEDTDIYYAGADLYALTSREDPFPSVVLESLDAAVPVVGFADAGGFADLAKQGVVTLVPAFDTDAFATALAALLANPRQRQAIGRKGQDLIAGEFGFRRYVLDLLARTGSPYPRISVVVPNYNYGRHLQERLESIAGQTMSVYEVIVLDDASTDGSGQWLRDRLHDICPEGQLVENETNSGSVFLQWLNGVERARGDYVWIAEADDAAAPGFLAQAMLGFDDPAVVLSYTQSKQVDERGEAIAAHYLDYVSDISPNKWRHAYTADGEEEIRTSLAVKNTIPNVSAVVFRREPLLNTLRSHMDSIRDFRVAGDWYVYIELLRQGRIAFSPRPLNSHRRHAAGVTISGLDRNQWEEIRRMQRKIRNEFRPSSEVTRAADGYLARLAEPLGTWRSAE